MKKIIIAITMVVAFIIPLSAFSWEGAIDASANVSGTLKELDFEQVDRVTLGFYAPLNDENSMSISAKAFYEFGYTFEINDITQDGITQLVDAEELKFNMHLPLDNTSVFSLDFGRFAINDVTTMIVNQISDGLKVAYENPSMKLSTYVGFTAFINAYNTSMNVAQPEVVLSDVYTTSAPFILANISLQLPQLFANQDVYAEVFSAIDMGKAKDPATNLDIPTTDNRIYSTLGLAGPLGNAVYYSLSSTVGVTQLAADKWGISNLSSFELSTFLPFASSLLAWKTVFATGGSDMIFNTFTVETATIDDSLEYAGHVKTGLVATLRPIDSLLLFVEPAAIFDVMNEAKGYLGFQWQFASRFNVTSDLQLVASAGQFIPEDGSEPYVTADLKLSFVF